MARAVPFQRLWITYDIIYEILGRNLGLSKKNNTVWKTDYYINNKLGRYDY
jgi:hypothetical protein